MTAPGRVAVAVGSFLLMAGAGPLAAQSPPNAPVNLEADVTSDRVHLTWDQDDSGPSAGSFRIYRDDAVIGTSSDEDYVDSDVEEGAQYTYEVSAVRFLVIEGERSDPLTVAIPGGDPPGRPDNLVAESVSSSQIDLRWDAVSGDDDDDDEPAVAGYYIYRDGGSVPHDSTGETQYSDTGLAAFTEYTYRVSAVSAGGVEGELSNSASARTADGSPPGAPQEVTAEAPGARVVELAWDAAEDPESGISLYLVYRDGDATPIDSTTATDYTDSTVEPETSYSYRIAARNGVGLEGPKSGATEVTTPTSTDESPPSVPADFSAEAVSSERVELTWTAAEDPESGVSAYRVYRNDSLLGTSPGVGYVDLTVEPNTTYEYEVSAVNGDGFESARASAPPVTTPDNASPPGAPTNVTAEAPGARLVELAWNAASDPESGISLYLVYRDGGAQPIDSTTATGYTDGAVEPETSYTYQVAARNGVGLEGPKSDEVQVTTPAATDQSPPSVPADFSAEAVSANRVELTWSAADDPESGISAYRVYRDDTLLGTSPGVGYVDLTVEPSTTYEYEVAAVNGDGLESARASAPAVTTPDPDDEEPADTVPPAPPSGLRVVSD